VIEPALEVMSQDANGLAGRFDRDGVVLVRDIFSRSAIAKLERNVERYRRWLLAGVPQEWVRYERDGSVRGMYYLDRVDPFFRAFGEQEQLRELVERIGGVRALFSSVETFHKPAEVGSAARAHQDAIYFLGRPVRIIHIWIPLDAARAENGALRYWPGTHSQGLLPHEPVPEDPYLKVVPDAVVQRLGPPAVAELDPGSVSVHADRILHTSPPNNSLQQRRAVVVAFKVASTAVS
jgi:phytanoyl-CoA hydroxylase